MKTQPIAKEKQSLTNADYKTTVYGIQLNNSQTIYSSYRDRVAHQDLPLLSNSCGKGSAEPIDFYITYHLQSYFKMQRSNN